LPLPFPDPDHERERDALLELAGEEGADVLDGRKLEHVVPVAMVVLLEHLARARLEVVEVHDHPAAVALPLDDDLHLVGMAVHRPAFGVAGQEMRAVDVFGDAEAHGTAQITADRIVGKDPCRAAARTVA
jgi:hypothetical protein